MPKYQVLSMMQINHCRTSLLLLFLYALLGVAVGSTYTIYCSDNSAGFCTSWSVDQPGAACFTHQVRVKTPEGLKTLEELTKGDKVLGMVDGREQYTEVTSWFHREPSESDNFLRLHTQQGFLEVSPKHNLASFDLSFGFATELSDLYQAGPITRVESFTSTGLYSPKTASNNFFVYLNSSGSLNKESKTLAHCYSHIRYPLLSEPFVGVIESLKLGRSRCQEQIDPSQLQVDAGELCFPAGLRPQ